VVTPIVEKTRYLNLDRDQAYAAVPGRRLSAQACAEVILRGVVRNRAVIAPGEAWQIALIYRFFPGMVEWGMLRAGRRLAAVRARFLDEKGGAPR
jgi:hypothetical protein